MSYKYVSKKEIKPYSVFCSSKMNELKQELQKKGISCTFYSIGSRAKNMVTQNEDAPFDLDYNLEIQSKLPKKYSDLQKLKDLIRSEMDKLIANCKDYSYGKDSTSALTYILHHNNTPTVKFSFDIGIVARNKKGNLQRLIHNKRNKLFLWNEAKDSKDIEERAKKLKLKGFTNQIRNCYLKKKNDYLSTNKTEEHPSFNIYIETINELYSNFIEKNNYTVSKEKNNSQKYLSKINEKNAYMYLCLFMKNNWIENIKLIFELKYKNGLAYWQCHEKNSNIQSPQKRKKREARNSVSFKILKNKFKQL